MHAQATKPERVPRNGRYFVGLLAGGWPAQYDEMKVKLLEEFGVALEEHWPSSLTVDRVRAKSIPRGTEVVVVIADAMRVHAKEIAEKASGAGAALALVGRRKPEWISGMVTAGFATPPPWRGANPATPHKAPPPTPDPGSFERYVEPSTIVGGPDDFGGEDAPHAPSVARLVEAEIARGAAPAVAELPVIKAAITDERYVVPAGRINKGVWPDEHVHKCIALAESDTPAERFCDALAAATGVYRTAGAIHLRLEPLRVIAPRISRDLVRGLERLAKEATTRKRDFLAAEQKAYKARGIDGLGEWVSADMAALVLGGVSHRASDLEVRQDKQTGLYVNRREDLAKRHAELLARNGGRALTRDPVPPVPKNSDEDVERAILAAIAERPGMSKAAAANGAPTMRDRAARIIERLIASGKLIASKHVSKPDVVVLHVPRPATPPPKAEPAAAAPPVLPALTAEIYRAIRAKEITPTEGAEMLRELAKGK